jgi:hypothetical protein
MENIFNETHQNAEYVQDMFRKCIDDNIQHKNAVYWEVKLRCSFPSSLILVTLIMQVIICSETSLLSRAIWRNISGDGILYVVLGLYIMYCVW